MHGGADCVCGERGRDRVFGLLDFTGDLVIRLDDAFGGELLKAAAAGIDLTDGVATGGVNDQVLQYSFGADAGFERGILGRCRRVVRTLAGDRTS
jgi:hypothetical protein